MNSERSEWIRLYLETVGDNADLVSADEFMAQYPASRFAIEAFIKDSAGES